MLIKWKIQSTNLSEQIQQELTGINFTLKVHLLVKIAAFQLI